MHGQGEGTRSSFAFLRGDRGRPRKGVRRGAAGGARQGRARYSDQSTTVEHNRHAHHGLGKSTSISEPVSRVRSSAWEVAGSKLHETFRFDGL